MHRIDLTPVYVLHTRSYRNTSLLVELFSQTQGRISAVAHSARGPKSRYRGQLQVFTPLLASWSSTRELKTLGQVELHGMPLQLNHEPLFCAFYLNELLMRVLQKEDPYPQLFLDYHAALIALEKNDYLPVVLRRFEKRLLESLGYGLPLMREAETQQPIDPQKHYRFVLQQGLFVCDERQDSFLGADLIAIAQEKFGTEEILRTAKKLTRLALAPVLGANPLFSRMLF